MKDETTQALDAIGAAAERSVQRPKVEDFAPKRVRDALEDDCGAGASADPPELTPDEYVAMLLAGTQRIGLRWSGLRDLFVLAMRQGARFGRVKDHAR